MVVLELRAENVKKLKLVQIRPKGSMVQITGKNGNGKTSVLDCISYALEGTEGLPSQVIRRGEAGAWIELTLGDEEGAKIIVTRSFSDKGTTSLTMKSTDGKRYPTPQALLDGLLSHLGFDPLAFMRMKPRDQVDELRNLVKLDIDMTKMDTENGADYAMRTQVKRDVKGLEAQLAAIPEPVADLPAKPIDISKMISSLEVAGTRNLAIAALETQVAAWRKNAEVARLQAEAQRAQIADLERAIAGNEEDAQGWEKKVADQKIPPAVDTAQLGEEIKNAQATNRQIEKREQRNQLEARKVELEAQVVKLTDQMTLREEQKRSAIAKVKLPVEGLSFNSGEVMFNELPLTQASSSEQLRVSVAIAMATNPKLKVIRISDGSLLDEDSLDMIANMAEKESYQIWIERVDSSGKVGVVMEDGEVAAVNEEPDRHGKAHKRAPKKSVQKVAV